MKTTLGRVAIGSTKETRLGTIWVAVSDQGIAAIEWHAGAQALTETLHRRGFGEVIEDPQSTGKAVQEIEAYLEGKLLHFSLPVDWRGLSAFQEKVLRATCAIPAGEVRTYAQIAASLGRPQAARAVGRAEATNPLPLIIPCHRVMGSDGKYHGYGGPGGIETKAWLLKMEASQQARV